MGSIFPLRTMARVARLLRCRRVALLGVCVAGSMLAAQPARAQVGSARYSSIVVDNASGRVIESANPDAARYPASLTKLMTLYMAFEALRDHRILLNERVPVSPHAASMEPSKLGLVPGTYFTVNDAILAIVTKSANDAACALGEMLGGTEEHFAQMMTMRARALGMSRSTFRNASGLPDPQQTTTARDLALLTHHLLRDFPGDYHYFSVPMFYFHGRAIPNHDHMLTDYPGADGLKTGYTNAAGHNLVTSALRGGVRLIGVVMGARSNTERDLHMASLLDEGFEQMGVPVMRRTPHHFRFPALIASAEASTLSSAGFRRAAYHRATSHHATDHLSWHHHEAGHIVTASHHRTHSQHVARIQHHASHASPVAQARVHHGRTARHGGTELASAGRSST